MRRAAAALALGACAATPEAEPDRRYITIGADAVSTAQAIADVEIVEAGDGAVVLAIDARDLRALSEQMHVVHRRCGGFLLHDDADDARLALRPVLRRVGPPVDYTLDDAPAVEAAVAVLDAAEIVATITHLSSYQNRYYSSPTGAAASDWLAERWTGLARAGVTVEQVDHGYPQRSVVLTIPGHGELAEEVVVLGAHLDSIAQGGPNSTAPGADDDASGVAVLTETARVLLAAEYYPARTIKLIAYAAEEIGLRGSQAIANDHRDRGVAVAGVLQLDMTSFRGSEEQIWLMQDYTDDGQNAFVADLIDTYVGATWATDECGYGCSDHASWHRAGFPASMPFEARVGDHNPAIHTSNDTLDTIDPDGTNALVFARLAAAFAVELGEGQIGQPPVPPDPPMPPTGEPPPEETGRPPGPEAPAPDAGDPGVDEPVTPEPAAGCCASGDRGGVAGSILLALVALSSAGRRRGAARCRGRRSRAAAR